MVVESIGCVMLRLFTSYVLVLNNILYVPSMRSNLFLATQFVKDDFSYVAMTIKFNFYLKISLIIFLAMHISMVIFGKFNALTFLNVLMLNILHQKGCSIMKLFSCFGIEDLSTFRKKEC